MIYVFIALALIYIAWVGGMAALFVSTRRELRRVEARDKCRP